MLHFSTESGKLDFHDMISFDFVQKANIEWPQFLWLEHFFNFHSTACSMFLCARKMHSHIVVYLHGAISCFHNVIVDMNLPLENLSARLVIIKFSKSFIYISVHNAVVVNECFCVQIWSQPPMRQTWTSPRWLTHYLNDPLMLAGWSCSKL